MEKWFKFTAYNSQAHFGFGTADEADKYCDALNRRREVNHYHYSELSDEEAAGLDNGADTDGFALDLALDTIAENEEWLAAQEAQ